MNRKFRFSGHFRKRMFILALITGIIISISMPVTYLVMAMVEEKDEATYHSRQLAEKLAASVKENPLLWRYNAQKFTQIFSENEKASMSCVKLYDSSHRLVRHDVFSEQNFLEICGTYPIKYNNKVYGYVKVAEKTEDAVYSAGGLFLFFAAIGLLIGVTLYRYPTTMVVNAEQETNKTYKKLGYITLGMGEGLYVTDRDGNITFVNPAAERLLGRSAEELQIKGVTENLFRSGTGGAVPDQIAAPVKPRLTRSGGSVTEDVFVRKDGSKFPVSCSTTPVYEEGEVFGHVTVFHDITDRKKIERELRHRIEIEKLINSISTNFINLDIAEIDTGINRALQQVGEFSGADRSYVFLFSRNYTTMENTHCWVAKRGEPNGTGAMLASDQFPWFMKRILDLKNTCILRKEDLPAQAYTEKNHCERFSVKSAIQVPMTCGKSVIGFLGIDATQTEQKWSADTILLLKILGGIFANALERKRSGQALMESEARLRRITDNMLDIIVQIDTNGIIQYASPSYKTLLGYDPEYLIGKSMFELVHRDDKKRTMKVVRTFVEGAVPGKVEFRHRHVDGRYLWLESVSSLLRDDDGKVCGVVSCTRDVTERKRLQQEVARLDRLHLVGEMAAGIGHEIRNPMTTVRGFLQMLGDKKESHAYKEYYDLMIEELDRANSIIKEYLYLAKNKAVHLDAKNLNTVVRALYPLIQADATLCDKRVTLDLMDVPDLLLDEKEVRQLILNLARNGLEAMSSGGNLTIRTYAHHDSVTLAVQDEGKGIEPAIIDKLGTPFFTTKDQGTGLGLAVCYSIAKRHNASIKIETGPAGSTFYVQFNNNTKAARSLA